ncbi:S-adenosyl-L-methionine dependent methyltransferase [Trametopsis cervina]|nr:S-adenosyl-L-methionine dependent methyltransferase [Trametopsis cervina]
MHASAKIYTRFGLRLYDFIVLAVSNAFAWRCSTKKILLPFFAAHIGVRSHLDVGVGTGYYPAHVVGLLEKNETRLTLMDMNPNTLEASAHRVEAAGFPGEVETIVHDVFDVAPLARYAPFDAISLFYLFHCLPGPIESKASRIFARLKPLLAADGRVYGATILVKGVQHNWLGSKLLGLYNKKGVFGNSQDDLKGLETALREHFEEVEVRIEGTVALFVGSKPWKT